jgi:nitrogen fixation NifU-like protein
MRDVWSLYSEKVMEHFRNPRNVGVIQNADGVGYVGDPSWGIDMELYIKVEDGIIVDAKFKTFGCGASIATASMVTEMVKGKSIEKALGISKQAIAEALGGLPPPKTYSAILGQELIKSAIDDYLAKNCPTEIGSNIKRRC